MMPPKKSPAARTSNAKNSDDVNDKDVKEVKSDDDVIPIPKKNIFTDTLVLEGKRKRCLPPSLEMLNKWLTANFEKSTDVDLSTSVNDTYDHYVTACISANNVVPVKVEELRKTLSEMFGRGFLVKDDSAYKGVIRKQKKKKKSSATKVQADTLKLKMKDILQTTFTTLGNPKKGLRFRALQQSIAANFPALRIELHPAILKRALERGTNSGDFECLRGIGACGYYRMYVEDEDEAKKQEDADSDEGSKVEGKESKSKDVNDVESKKGPTDGSGDIGDIGKQEEEGEKEVKKKTEQGKEKKTTKHSSKPKNKKKRADRPKHKIVHGDPQKVEDCFPMAFTFMSEPKAASIGKIKKYLVQQYNVQREDKIKNAVKYGIESGYWEQVSGSGFSGKLELTVETFNPSDDRDMCGKIMNAIVACSEPKICSAKLLRNYIVAYHSKFNILEKTYLFKNALERAIHRGIIKQLTGIGASGSYQMTIPFVPNPIILAGKDSEDDYASSDSEIACDTVNQLELYRDAYVPRPTKRHGHGRQTGTSTKPAVSVRPPPTARQYPPKKRQLQKPLSPKKNRKTAKSENGLSKKKSHKRSVPQKRARSSDDDVPEVKGKSSKRVVPLKRGRSPSSSDDDVPEVKGKSSKRAVPQKKGRSPSSSDDDVPEVKGKSSKRAVPQKRGRSPSSSDDDVPEVKRKSSKRAQPQKRARSPSPSNSDESGPTEKRKLVPRSSHKKIAYDSAEDRMSDAGSGDSYTPCPTKSRSPRASQPVSHKKTPVSRKMATPRNTNGKPQKMDRQMSESEDSMLDASDGECYSPRPTKSRRSSLTTHKKISLSKQGRSLQVGTIDLSSDEMSDAPGEGKATVQKRKSAAKKGGKRRR